MRASSVLFLLAPQKLLICFDRTPAPSRFTAQTDRAAFGTRPRRETCRRCGERRAPPHGTSGSDIGPAQLEKSVKRGDETNRETRCYRPRRRSSIEYGRVRRGGGGRSTPISRQLPPLAECADLYSRRATN